MRRLFACAVLALPLAACTAQQQPSDETEPAVMITAAVGLVDAPELAQLVENDQVTLIDVRTPEEFAASHIAGALNAPVETFDPASIPVAAKSETILYCRSGRRSEIAAEMLSKHLGREVRHLDGGILAWERAGKAVTAPMPAQ